MDPIYIVGIVVVLLVGAAVGVLFAIPKTRPYIKTWWPVAVIVVVAVLVALLFRRKPRNSDKVDGGSTALDDAIKKNENKLLEVQIKTEAASKAADVQEEYVSGELDRIDQINDPYEEFAAKKRLLDHVRGK